MATIKLDRLDDGFYSYGTTPADTYWVERVRENDRVRWNITFAEDTVVQHSCGRLADARAWLAEKAG